jgi:hypothetical protein
MARLVSVGFGFHYSFQPNLVDISSRTKGFTDPEETGAGLNWLCFRHAGPIDSRDATIEFIGGV